MNSLFEINAGAERVEMGIRLGFLLTFAALAFIVRQPSKTVRKQEEK